MPLKLAHVAMRCKLITPVAASQRHHAFQTAGMRPSDAVPTSEPSRRRYGRVSSITTFTLGVARNSTTRAGIWLVKRGDSQRTTDIDRKRRPFPPEFALASRLVCAFLLRVVGIKTAAAVAAGFPPASIAGGDLWPRRSGSGAGSGSPLPASMAWQRFGPENTQGRRMYSRQAGIPSSGRLLYGAR